MRIDYVVPIGKHSPPFPADVPALFLGRSLGGVFLLIQAGPALKPLFRMRGPNVLQHGCVTGQRLAGPMGADQAEHALVKRIPFRCSRRIVRHGADQAELVGQGLQRDLPFPFAMVVGSAAVHLDQQMVAIPITASTDLPPPAANDSFVWQTSFRPLAIVLRSMPVIRSSSTRWPGPLWRAKKPSKSLRNRSSATAKSRLLARCSWATQARGCCWQIEQEQTWTSCRCPMGAYLHDEASKLVSSLYHRPMNRC